MEKLKVKIEKRGEPITAQGPMDGEGSTKKGRILDLRGKKGHHGGVDGVTYAGEHWNPTGTPNPKRGDENGKEKTSYREGASPERELGQLGTRVAQRRPLPGRTGPFRKSLW